MSDYFTLVADMARTHYPAAETRGLLMAKPWRDIKHKSLTSQTFHLSDDDLDAVAEGLRIAKTATQDEISRSRWISDSHREYLLKWAERFEDLRLKIEER